MQNLVERLDERLVGLLQRFDVDDTAFRFLRHFDGGGVQHLGILLQQIVRHVGDGGLRAHGLFRIRDAERQNHLALPQRNGIHDGGLDFLDQRDFVVLHEADLRRGLHGDGTREVEVGKLLFEARAHGVEVLRGLRVFGTTRGFRLVHKLLQLDFAHFSELFLAGKNVHGELFEVGEVELVHLVERGGVFHEGHLMALQRLHDFVDVGLGLVVACAHRFDFVGTLLEEAEQPLFFGRIEAAQLGHSVGKKASDLAQILRAHAFKRGVAEIGHFLLGAGAVLQDHRGVAHIDLLREAFDHLLLFFGQHAVVELRGHFGCGVARGGQGVAVRVGERGHRRGIERRRERELDGGGFGFDVGHGCAFL